MPNPTTLIKTISNLFFPQLCAGCGSDLVSNSQLLCLQCTHELPYTNFHLHGGNPVEKIFWGRVPVKHAASIFYLTKDSRLEKLLYLLKYKGIRRVGDHFGQLIGECIIQSPFAAIDALVPLPLFPKKEKLRGYNQSAIICEGMAAIMHKPIWKDVIRRATTTETQTHKNRVERWQNMKGRFVACNAAKLSGRHVLLVDDVVTTGATLEACGSELVAAGASVSILTVAYASS